MESSRYQSHLSWISSLQLAFLTFLFTWQMTHAQGVGLGANCSVGQTCVNNAYCNTENKCQCNSTYYNNNGVCVQKVALGVSCSGGQTCVDNAYCNTENKCQCNSTYYNSGGLCVPKVALGVSCSGGQTCVDNAHCITENKCQCNSTYYNNNGVCVPKVAVGVSCSGGQPCVNNNYCNADDKCQCNSTYYNNNGLCVPKVDLGVNCSGGQTCVDNAYCNNEYKCQCNSTHYNNNGECVPKVALGVSCSGGQTCVDNAHCITENKCQCNSTYYNNNGVCVPKVAVGVSCSGGQPCVNNNYCNADDKCQCNSTYYNNNGLCVPKVDLGVNCSGGQTCVDNAYCNNEYKCQCNSTHYNNNGECVPKVALGVSCSGGQTCVDNAHCITENKCQCNSTYYNNNGVCVPKVAVGVSCSGGQPCVNNNYCNADDKCQCSSTYYNNNGLCVPKVDLGVNCSGGQTCVDNAYCNNEYKCQCNSTHYNNNGECVPKVGTGADCSGGKTCVDNAYCNNNKCQCNPDCYNNSGSCQPKVAIGADCSGGKTCVDYATCNNNKCQCNPDYYNNSGVCQPKVAIGADCSGGKTCVDNAYCNSKNNSGVCQPRLDYGMNCTSDNMCSWNMTCGADRNNVSRCLCEGNLFRFSNVCNSVTILKLADLSRSSTEEETLNVTWQQLSVGENITYSISLNSFEMQVVSSPFAVFTSKVPGTLYTASVTPSTLKDPRYSDQRVSSDPVTRSFYTKPAKPGELTDKVYAGPNGSLTFYPSKGNVDYYTVNIASYKAVNSSNNKTEVEFVNLTPGAFYDVTIVAVSGGIISDIRVGNFRVQVELAGPVKDLVINNHGSRWVFANWMRPLQPNGVIYGYTVEVFPDGSSTCASGVAVVCSNCSYVNITVPSVMNCTVKETKNQTADQLSAANTKQEVNVTSLLPDITYTVKVLAFNEKGEGKMAEKQIKTNMEAAQDLRELHVTPQPVGQLVVTWTPGERTGPTNYTLSWSEETAMSSSEYANTSIRIFTDFNTRSYTIRGLLSYWNYNISVQVVTPVGLPTEKHTINKTSESQPAAVSLFNISQPSDSSKELNFTVRCPAERERNGPITAIAYNSTFIHNQASGPSGRVSVSDCEKDYFIVVPVIAEKNYTFNVFAKTDIYDGNLKSAHWFVKATAPKFVGSAGFNNTLLTTDRAPSPTQNTATVIICPCLADTSHGNIVWMGLVVCKKSANRKCQSDGASDYSSYLQKEVKTWKQFKDSNYEGSYRPTPDNWAITTAPTRRKRSTFIFRWAREVSAAGVEFIVGYDTTCEQQGSNVYCNGPLPDDTEFVIQAFACTAGGCTLASEGITVVTTKFSDDPPIGAIVGGIIGGLAALLIIVCIVRVLMRLRRNSERVRANRPSTRELPPRMPVLKEDDWPRVPLFHFEEYIRQMHLDASRRFKLQFQELWYSKEKQSSQFTMHVGNDPVNHVKNRSQDILPYDHSRVVLLNSKNGTQDYINASYVTGTNSPCEYIATQGPLYSTLADFWRMVYEHKSGVIVMLCDIVDNGKKTVDPYWPDDINLPMQHGNLTVTMTSTSDLSVYTVRKMIARMRDRQDLRVTQFCIHGWSERGCSLPVEKLIQIIRVVGQEAKRTSGPVTVHCNLGVGRTGMFIALDLLTRFVDNHELDHEVNVYAAVQRMLGCRPNIIQSLEQYMFIHDILKVIIGKKMRSSFERTSVVYQNRGHTENDYAGLDQHNSDGNIYSSLNEHQIK